MKMHPAISWWNSHRRGSCGEDRAGCGPRGGGWAGWGAAPFHGGGGGGGGGDDAEAGGFGVRRPLRFLAFKLELDDAQVAELASILDELKIERAQAMVDHRRSTSALADAITADAFDPTKASGATAERVKSSERVQAAVVRSLGRMHALLRPEQRGKLAYLLRTGALAI
jgi:Spy/CpxP family protein refolding chaperone